MRVGFAAIIEGRSYREAGKGAGMDPRTLHRHWRKRLTTDEAAAIREKERQVIEGAFALVDLAEREMEHRLLESPEGIANRDLASMYEKIESGIPRRSGRGTKLSGCAGSWLFFHLRARAFPSPGAHRWRAREAEAG